MTWDVFASRVRTSQKGFMGEPMEVKLGRGEFHENPHSCICEKAAGSGSEITTTARNKSGINHLSSEGGEQAEYVSVEGELDWHDLDYGETVPLGKSLPNRTETDYDTSVSSEEPELETMLSD